MSLARQTHKSNWVPSEGLLPHTSKGVSTVCHWDRLWAYGLSPPPSGLARGFYSRVSGNSRQGPSPSAPCTRLHYQIPTTATSAGILSSCTHPSLPSGWPAVVTACFLGQGAVLHLLRALQGPFLPPH